MKWFLDLTTRNKPLLGFGLMIAFLATVIAAAYWSIASIQTSQRTLYQKEFANAYIVKSSFDQSNLLEIIKRLI